MNTKYIVNFLKNQSNIMLNTYKTLKNDQNNINKQIEFNNKMSLNKKNEYNNILNDINKTQNIINKLSKEIEINNLDNKNINKNIQINEQINQLNNNIYYLLDWIKFIKKR